jgi:hypothetical protein
MGQTEDSMYFAFESFDPDMPRLAAAITQRDVDLEKDDSVAVMLDPFLDKRTAYVFYSNPLATQLDGRMADNGRTLDPLWDAQWRSAARRYGDRWIVEMEIPFAILKYPQKTGDDPKGSWGINFLRTIPRNREQTLWAKPAESAFRVSAFGILEDASAPGPLDRWQFIPYLLASIGEGDGTDVQVGGDVRWRPSAQIGVDLTFNPDFALVEADVETINLTRFELLIPEKRPFFLEGNEMYKQRIQQFYSRRIGDISYGAKSNGKIKRTDFSVIATSEDLQDPLTGNESRADYGILRFQHNLSRGSNIGLLAANRRWQNENSGSVGIDSTLFFTDTLGMTAQLLRVHGPQSDGGLAWFVRPSWDTSTSHFHIRYTNLDAGIKEDFNAAGFLQDDDRKEIDTRFRHKFWLDGGPVEQVEPSVNYNRYWSQDGILRSWELEADLDTVFRNGIEIGIEYFDEYKLFEKPFRNDRITVDVAWDARDGRYLKVYAGKGENFDEQLSIYGAEVRWPFGDHLRFSYELKYLDLDPDAASESTTIHIFEALYSFHTDLYAKVFVQTNSAIGKENIQAVWMWRFKPPFGSLQFAYQRGSSEQGQVSEQGNTIFSKLAWVF